MIVLTKAEALEVLQTQFDRHEQSLHDGTYYPSYQHLLAEKMEELTKRLNREYQDG